MPRLRGRGLTSEEITDILNNDRRRAREERNEHFQSMLENSAEVSNLEPPQEELIPDHSNTSDSNRILNSIEEIHKVLQSADSETEDVFPENDFDHDWLPEYDSDYENDNVIEDLAVQNDSPQNISSAHLLTNGESQQTNSLNKNKKVNTSTKRKRTVNLSKNNNKKKIYQQKRKKIRCE